MAFLGHHIRLFALRRMQVHIAPNSSAIQETSLFATRTMSSSLAKEPKEDARSQGIKGARHPQIAGRSPTKYDKWCLVRTKVYPNKEAVPEMVGHHTMKNAKDKCRVIITIYMMITCLVMCFLTIQLGKYDRSRGISLNRGNMYFMGKWLNVGYHPRGQEDKSEVKSEVKSDVKSE